MKQINEDYAFEQRRQAQLDAENSTNWPQFHQKVGTVIPFSRTVDRDPNPRIPLSVPSEVPSGKWIWVYIVLAVCLFVAAQWKW